MVRHSVSLPAAGIANEQNNSVPEKIKVWPELVMRETIASLAAFIVLGLLSVFIDAPLEGIADPSFSMNPSKAPWYFLGLQELLVYFSPWVAGVLIPAIIIFGLMAIPFIDNRSKEHSDRHMGIFALFTTGIVLWIGLTVIGLYFRGPNWAWQIPWDPAANIGSSHISMEWFFPLFLSSYLTILIFQKRRQVETLKSLGFVKYFISHTLIFSGAVVTSKIVIFTILDLTII
jgi:quinol-cytochrome oxidoreductase complex cytochrome b subunit